MMAPFAAGILLILGLTSAQIIDPIHDRDSYRAAVYEHVRFEGDNNTSPDVIVDTNLRFFWKAAEAARLKEADIIVYPEYGLFSASWNRSEIRVYLEDTPNPQTGWWNPCEQWELFSDRPILRNLSCIAKYNSIYIVAGTGDIKNCSGDPDCPDDGVFQFDTSVVFDRSGTLLVRYHKEHTFYEFSVDAARTQQDPTFQTDFGTFATYLSNDMDYARMSEVALWPNVDGIMLASMTFDQPAQRTYVQRCEAWSLGNNSTLVATNIQIPGYGAVGSGIFHPQRGALAYTFSIDGISKLTVATVPKTRFSSDPPDASTTAITELGSYPWTHEGQNMPLECSTQIWNDTVDIHKVYRCLDENYTDYTFVKLAKPSGNVQACNNGLCCSLNYATDGLGENFYLGVFSGIYVHFTNYSWCEEDCVLARCEPGEPYSCGTFISEYTTVWRKIQLSGNFKSKMVYPSIISNRMRLLPVSEWDRHGAPGSDKRTVHLEDDDGKKITIVGMKGRCYDRDPPYVS